MQFAQSAWAVEYTNCFSAENVLIYDTKQSDGEAPGILELWGLQSTPFITIAPRSTPAQCNSTR